MYEEDTYDPTMEDNYFEPYENESLSDNSDDFIEVSKKTKKTKGVITKNEDKDYHYIRRKINGRMVNIDLYETKTTPGTYIRDAITGAKNYQCKVGSSDENNFFKVKITTDDESIQDAHTFFFNTPESYERHTGAILSQSTKNAWIEKNTGLKII